jgi:DNA replication protein DnaC
VPATTIEENQALLTHPTLDQLRQLGLAGMARAFEELQANAQGADLAPAEWLGLLLDREVTDRHGRRLKARLRFAKLRHQASIEDIDWRSSRGLDRPLFQTLAMGGWIEAAENLIIDGPTGVGKSWLACALGQKVLIPGQVGHLFRSEVGHPGWVVVTARLLGEARSPFALYARGGTGCRPRECRCDECERSCG